MSISLTVMLSGQLLVHRDARARESRCIVSVRQHNTWFVFAGIKYTSSAILVTYSAGTGRQEAVTVDIGSGMGSGIGATRGGAGVFMCAAAAAAAA